MGKHKNATWGGTDAQSASPTPSSHRGEASDTGNAVQDLRDDVDSLEEGMSWIGASPKMPFRFTQSSWLHSEWSLMPEHQQDHPVPEEQMHYCIHVRVAWGEGGNQLPIPCMEWFVNCRYVLRRSQRADYQSGSTCPWGGSTILWMANMQGRTPLWKCQGHMIQLDGPHQLGW